MEVCTQAINNISINLNCSAEIIKHIQAHAYDMRHVSCTLRIKDADVFVKQNHRVLNYDIHKGII